MKVSSSFQGGGGKIEAQRKYGGQRRHAEGCGRLQRFDGRTAALDLQGVEGGLNGKRSEMGKKTMFLAILSLALVQELVCQPRQSGKLTGPVRKHDYFLARTDCAGR